MFQKVLVANRGEIAARIIEVLNAQDIVSVAVHSEADKMHPTFDWRLKVTIWVVQAFAKAI